MTPPTFYVDETYGPGLVRLLRDIDLHAVTYRDVPGIESGDRDVDWIPNVAERRWIAVTGDKRLRRKLVELHAIQNARLGLVLVATRLSTEEEAAHVVQYPAQLVLQGRALREHIVSPVAPSGGFLGRRVEVDQFGHAAEFRQQFRMVRG